MMSVKAMSLILLWCKQIKKDALLSSAFTFMWQFFWRITRSPHSFSEVPGILDALSAVKLCVSVTIEVCDDILFAVALNV
jgi:hypothetical protein